MRGSRCREGGTPVELTQHPAARLNSSQVRLRSFVRKSLYSESMRNLFTSNILDSPEILPQTLAAKPSCGCRGEMCDRAQVLRTLLHRHLSSQILLEPFKSCSWPPDALNEHQTNPRFLCEPHCYSYRAQQLAFYCVQQ